MHTNARVTVAGLWKFGLIPFSRRSHQKTALFEVFENVCRRLVVLVLVKRKICLSYTSGKRVISFIPSSINATTFLKDLWFSLKIEYLKLKIIFFVTQFIFTKCLKSKEEGYTKKGFREQKVANKLA